MIDGRVMRLYDDVDAKRFIARRTNVDVVRARTQIQVLKHAVEVIDDSRVAAVDKDIGVLRFDLETQPARRSVRRKRLSDGCRGV